MSLATTFNCHLQCVWMSCKRRGVLNVTWHPIAEQWSNAVKRMMAFEWHHSWTFDRKLKCRLKFFHNTYDFTKISHGIWKSWQHSNVIQVSRMTFEYMSWWQKKALRLPNFIQSHCVSLFKPNVTKARFLGCVLDVLRFIVLPCCTFYDDAKFYRSEWNSIVLELCANPNKMENELYTETSW